MKLCPVCKMRVRKSGAVLAASVLVVMLVALAQGDPSYSELPNFHQVNVQIYRGGQPKPGGLQRLKAMGVKTIVNLRGEDDHARAEGEEAQKLGLRYYSVSLPGFSKPRDEEVQRVLDIINTAENQPVFIHCHHGEDRTGTIIACYRISHDGWNVEQAKNEAKRYGMSWTQVGMKHYIDDYYSRQQRKKDANRQNLSSILPERTLQ
jgi:tyrosine-protein phosphatase SIW14